MISSSAGAARTLRGVVVPGTLILVLVIIASSGCEVMGCHDEERSALLGIKASMNKNDGFASQSWGNSAGDDCCQWRGIDCDPNTGRVVAIDLYGEMWSDTGEGIPQPNLTMLAKFGQLESLNLAMHKSHVFSLSFAIFSNLTRLSFLEIDGDGLDGTFRLAVFTNLSKLEYVYIQNQMILMMIYFYSLVTATFILGFWGVSHQPLLEYELGEKKIQNH
ncbi:unnamed protein product [Spirodela intermedia]|uniref:Leucine-rich repeat-containing N-terminal plant-type domain-containing protein n=1 Tax=Spirodela intermedia TaxID=51605 RepID=A0A7I8JPN2_SPIIN|nr:unnamed protein product [Spirodela intermedia]CAA6672124.1 unnamed protein product [Spirodela intermedia]